MKPLREQRREVDREVATLRIAASQPQEQALEAELEPFLAALTVSLFESTISRVIALAVFLPVVASQGGIGGTQTVTLVVRSMALGEVPRRLGLRLLARELALGLVHGVALGIVVGIVAYLWKGNFTLGLVLGVARLM